MIPTGSNPDPQTPVHCGECFFVGILAQCFFQQDAAAECPICHTPVERVYVTDEPQIVEGAERRS